MKTVFTFLLTSLMAVTLHAADVSGSIVISFTSNKDYQVLIDGHLFSSFSDRIYVNDIRPGRHTIQVYTSGRKRRGDREVYSSFFLLRPQYDLNIWIDRDGQALVQEQRGRYDRNYNNQNNRGYNGDDRTDDKDYRNRDNNKDYNHIDRNDNINNSDYNKGVKDRSKGNDNDYNGDRNGNANYDGNNKGAMPDYEFSQLIQKIRNQWSGNDKMNTAKDALTHSTFTTLQVRQIVQLFTFESDKLQLAKQAYSHTADPKNYVQLYDVFSLQSSRDDLSRYTRDYR